MCGRFILRTFPASFSLGLRLHLPADPNPDSLSPADPPRYNIAPSQPVAVVVDDKGSTRKLRPMIWGLIPHWSKERPSGGGWINARSETVFDKPSFRAAAKYRRCLVPSDGYYEWRASGGTKTPYLFEQPDGSPFCFAGIWDHWTAPDGSEVETVAILTTSASFQFASIHDRSPVILQPADYDAWTQTSPEAVQPLKRLFEPPPEDFLTSRVVSKLVNNPRNDTPECVLSPD